MANARTSGTRVNGHATWYGKGFVICVRRSRRDVANKHDAQISSVRNGKRHKRYLDCVRAYARARARELSLPSVRCQYGTHSIRHKRISLVRGRRDLFVRARTRDDRGIASVRNLRRARRYDRKQCRVSCIHTRTLHAMLRTLRRDRGHVRGGTRRRRRRFTQFPPPIVVL